MAQFASFAAMHCETMEQSLFLGKELLKISVAGQMTSSPVIIVCSCLLRAVVFPGPNSGAIDTVVKRRMKTQI